jgi:septal ring factor EnvC (AmiA/AmiB activator)
VKDQKKIITNWHHLTASLLALVFLIFGSSAHIPIANALHDAHDQHQYDYTAEAEESLEEKQEEVEHLQSSLFSLARKYSQVLIHVTRCRIFEVQTSSQAKYLDLIPRHYLDILLATGRLCSGLPG